MTSRANSRGLSSIQQVLSREMRGGHDGETLDSCNALWSAMPQPPLPPPQLHRQLR